MSDSAFVSLLIGSMFVAFMAAYTWGKYSKMLKDLGRAA